MSITWGSWQNTSSNGMRIGYRVSRTSVSSSSSSVTFTVRIYTQNRYPFADNQHIDFGSYLGSRHNFYNGSSGGAVLRTTRRYTYSYSDYGRSRTLSSSAQVGGVWSGLTPRVTIRMSVPARPYRSPLAPTGLYISSQVSSGALVLNWTNRRNSGSGRPYSSQRIEYSYYHSSGSWTGWRFLATVSSGASSYRYDNLYQNTRYQFRVRANNSAGSSGWSGTVVTNTVPAAPTNARARVQPSGSEISVTWTRNNQRGDGVIFHQVQRQTSSGGSWSTVASRLSSTTTSWIDESPNAGYNRYRVRAFLDNEYLTQYSSFSTAPSITTIVPPLAPSSLAVSPRVPDFNNEVTLTWTHRDGGDGADQTYYEVGYSEDGGDTWDTTGAVQTTTEEHTFAPGTLDNGVDYVLRVRTRGNTQEGFGPWSSVRTVTGWTTPTVTLVEDMPADVVNTIPFMIEWIYNQDEDRAQLSADVEIWTLDADGDGNVERGMRVVNHRVRGADTFHECEHILEDGAQFLVRVRATSSREQTSVWYERVITIDLLPPARASLRPQYDRDSGVMVLEVEPHAPRYGVEVARNLVRDPNFINGEIGSWSAYTNQLEITQSYAQMWNEKGGYKLQHTNTSNAWFNGVRHEPFGIEPGQWLGIRALVATESWNVAHFRVQWLDATGTEISSDDSDRVSAGWYDGAEISAVFEAPEGTAQVRVLIFQRRSSGTLQGGERLWVGRVAFVVASSQSMTEANVAYHFDGDSEPTDTHAFGWAGEAGNSPSIKYELVEHVEGDDAEPFEAGIMTFDVQRSIDNGGWTTILAGVDATTVDEGDGEDEGGIISLMDLLPAINGTNRYRLILYSFAPSVGDTSPVAVPVTPADNAGWTFLNYGSDMGSVLRVGNNVTVAESMDTTGDDVYLQGRRRPVSLFGEHETRQLDISGRLYHDELQAAPSAQSPLDSPPGDWRMAQREANTVCLRTPAGHRIYGRMNGLSLESNNLNVTSLSFSVVENDLSENETTGAGVEVSN